MEISTLSQPLLLKHGEKNEKFLTLPLLTCQPLQELQWLPQLSSSVSVQAEAEAEARRKTVERRGAGVQQRMCPAPVWAPCMRSMHSTCSTLSLLHWQRRDSTESKFSNVFFLQETSFPFAFQVCMSSLFTCSEQSLSCELQWKTVSTGFLKFPMLSRKMLCVSGRHRSAEQSVVSSGPRHTDKWSSSFTPSVLTNTCNGAFQIHDRSLQPHLVWILIGNGSSVIKLNSEDIEASRQQRVQIVVVTAATRLVLGHQGGATSVLGGLWGHGGKMFETMFNQIELISPVSSKIIVSLVFILLRRVVLERNFKHSSLFRSANNINGFWVCWWALEQFTVWKNSQSLVVQRNKEPYAHLRPVWDHISCGTSVDLSHDHPVDHQPLSCGLLLELGMEIHAKDRNHGEGPWLTHLRHY